MTDRIFDLCVELLERVANKLGMTYEQVNVWIFCVLWPLITVAETATVIYLLCR